jgi:His/Glu/Gln/Arg/opine family amino acid ABC transporter permease subunit
MSAKSRLPHGVLVLRTTVILTVIILLAWYSRNFNWKVVWANKSLLIEGLGRTIYYSASAMVLGLVLGLILALGRVYGPVGIRHIAVGIIECVRGIPQLMVLFWVFFGLPEITGGSQPGSMAAMIGLTLIAGAYLAEDIRAGLSSVHPVQWESGYSAGLQWRHVFFFVALPQALRNMLPAILATSVTMVKVTALVYLVGVIDLFRAAVLINSRVYEPYALYLIVLVVYFSLNALLTYFIRKLDPKYILQS